MDPWSQQRSRQTRRLSASRMPCNAAGSRPWMTPPRNTLPARPHGRSGICTLRESELRGKRKGDGSPRHPSSPCLCVTDIAPVVPPELRQTIVRAARRRDYSESRISPGFMASATSWTVQRPPSSDFVTPGAVTTFISAMRPPPQKNVLPVMSLERSLAK